MLDYSHIKLFFFLIKKERLHIYCKVTNFSPDPKEIGSGNGPNKPNNNKFVREWVKELG